MNKKEFYSKTDIIELSGIISADERTLANQIDKIVELLESEKVMKAIRKHGAFHLEQKLNLDHNKSSAKNKPYRFNETTALVIVTLLRTYENPFFQAMLKDKITTEDEAADWMIEVEEEVINLLEDEYGEAEKKHKEDEYVTVYYPNIVEFIDSREDRLSEDQKSRIYDCYNTAIGIFTALNMMSLEQTKILDETARMNERLSKIMAMGNYSKYKMYQEAKSRWEYIYKLIDEIVADMDFIEKLEYETNIELAGGKVNIGELDKD